MIIFLYGPDAYRRRKKLDEIIAAYRQKHSALARERFDLSAEDDFWKFRDFIASRSLFERTKLAVLSGVFESARAKELRDVLKETATDKETTVLISESGKPPREFAFLLKGQLVQEFRELEPAQADFFIEKEAAEKGVALDEGAAKFLREICGGDSWRMANELEKLSLHGAGGKAGREEIAAVCGERPAADNFFAFLNSLGNSRPRAKVPLLESLFSKGEAAAKIFNVAAVRLPESWRPKMADYDADVKSGRLDYEEVLLDLALLS
ncbi:MAG: hypothetical protein AAB560_00855 [Patescibacteria group bacterium]